MRRRGGRLERGLGSSKKVLDRAARPKESEEGERMRALWLLAVACVCLCKWKRECMSFRGHDEHEESNDD